MRIGKRFRFEAAHQLVNHDGKCARPHGHSYEVEVVLYGHPELEAGHPKQGMVLDFSILGAAFKTRVHDFLDHQDLNVVLPNIVTTAENLAAWIHGELSHELSEALPGGTFGNVESVTVWETATSWAQYP